MNNSFGRIIVAGFIFAAGSAFAQDTTNAETPATEEPATQTDDATTTQEIASGLTMGTAVESEPAIGSVYSRGTYDDWDLRCVIVPEGEKEPCTLYQLLTDNQGTGVAEFNIFSLPKGQQAAAGANIITPLETLLTKRLTIGVDGGQKKRYPYSWCSAIGCLAQVGFTSGDIAAFKRGANAKVGIVAAVAPNKTIELNVSLKGFTKGYEAVIEANK